jgi:hypothetical protein
MPVRLGAYYAGYQTDEREQRLRDIPRLAEVGFDWLASPFSDADPNCLKAAQLCGEKGLKVLLQPNALTPAQFKVKYGGLAHVDGIDIWDDAHNATPAEIAAKRDAWKAQIGDRATFISCARRTPTTHVNLCPWLGWQSYSWKEAGWLKQWYWDDLRRIRPLCTGRLVVHPFLGLNAIPYSLRDRPDWRQEDREYTPVAQNEAAMWLALCAGADDFCFYTAYELPNVGGIAFTSGRSYILDRPVWLEQYKAVFRQIRRYERYLVGRRELIEVGTVLGANWTLENGSGLRVTVDVESEVYPRLRFDTFQPPAPPVSATIRVSSDGKTIKTEALP